MQKYLPQKGKVLGTCYFRGPFLLLAIFPDEIYSIYHTLKLSFGVYVSHCVGLPVGQPVGLLHFCQYYFSTTKGPLSMKLH